MTTPNIEPTPPPVVPELPSRISLGVGQLLGIIVGVMFIGMVAFWIGGRQKTDDYDVYRKDFKAYVDSTVAPVLAKSDSIRNQNIVLLKSVDSAEAVAESIKQKNAVLQSNIAKLNVQNKALRDSVISDTTLPPACDQCKRTVLSQAKEIDSLNKSATQFLRLDSTRVFSIDSLRSGNARLFDDNTALRITIDNFPKPKEPKKFLGIKFPKIPSEVVIIGSAFAGYQVGKKVSN